MSLRISSHRPTAQGCAKTSISNVQDDSDCPRLADKTMVLVPGGIVSGHPKTNPTHTHSAEATTEQPLPCQPNIPEPPHLVSRSSALQELLRDSPQDPSMLPSGPFSNVGAQTNRWTSGIPL